jgi:hypothetical protein
MPKEDLVLIENMTKIVILLMWTKETAMTYKDVTIIVNAFVSKAGATLTPTLNISAMQITKPREDAR